MTKRRYGMKLPFLFDGVYKRIEGGRVKLWTPRKKGDDDLVVYIESNVWIKMRERDIFDVCEKLQADARRM
jgi:hypothetical protein